MFSTDLPRAEMLLRAAAEADYTQSRSSSRDAFIRWQPRAWWALSCVIGKAADLRGLREAKPWLLRAAAAVNVNAFGVIHQNSAWFMNWRPADAMNEALYAVYWS